MNFPKEENNLFEFDISKLNVSSGADVTFSLIHPSFASSATESFIIREDSGYFFTKSSPENKLKNSAEELYKYEQLAKNKSSYHHSENHLNLSNQNNDSYFNSSEYILTSESPEKKIIKNELEKFDLNENLNLSNDNKIEAQGTELKDKILEGIFLEKCEKNSPKLSNKTPISLLRRNQLTLKITLNMEIKITGYVIKNIIIQHIKYILTIKKFENPEKLFSQKNVNEDYTYKIYRRYSEFKKLRDMLMKKYIGIFLPSLPRKQIFGSTDINLIEFRKKFLQIFLHELQLCFFFHESEEIKAFLNPAIEIFPPENLKILSEMNNLNEEFLFDEITENLRKTYKLNLDIFAGNSEVIKENCLSKSYNPKNIISNQIQIPNSIPNNVYKNLNISVIPDKIKNLNIFSNKLSKQKNFLEDFRLCLNHFIPQQKEFSIINSNFVEGLLEFQNTCISPMMDKNNFKEIKSAEKIKKKSLDKNILELEISKLLSSNTDVKEIITLKTNKSFSGILKNLHDWIYKEIIDSDSFTECIGNMKNYLNRLKEVEEEMKKFENKLQEKNKINYKKLDENPSYDDHGQISEYANLDMKEKFENKKDKLKEIITLTTLNLHDYEIEKFKNMKFEYYYNSLTFLIEQNVSSQENEDKLFNSILDNILHSMK